MFDLRRGPAGPECVVSVPPAFAAELLELLRPFASGSGHLSESRAERMLGKAGRLSFLIPTTRPYVNALWGALGGAREAAASHRREAPPGRVAARRFQQPAAWLVALLTPQSDQPDLPLEQVICMTLPAIDPQVGSVFFDASPWGAGAVLIVAGHPA